MYQILPFLEEGAVAGIVQQSQLQSTPIALYNCPSRRGITFNPTGGGSLVDYAGVTAGPSRSEIGDAEFNKYVADTAPTYTEFTTDQEAIFWGCGTCHSTLCQEFSAWTVWPGLEWLQPSGQILRNFAVLSSGGIGLVLPALLEEASRFLRTATSVSWC